MIVSIDPGQTTGIAILTNDKQIFVTTATNREQIWKLLYYCNENDMVVIEDFVTSGTIGKHGLHTVRLVGSVEGIGWTHGFEVLRQVPKYRMAGMKPAEYYMPKDSKHAHRHEKDALAHLIMWMSDNEPDFARDIRSLRAETKAVRKPISELYGYIQGLERHSGN